MDLRRLPGELEPATEFLKAHVSGPVKTKGSQILVEGVRHKDVKLLLHKFLHHRNLNGYRVLSQSGILEIAPPRMTESPKHAHEATPPPAAATMPYFFPGSPPVPVEKKVKKNREG